jgi:hypothetical protein
MNGFTEKGLDEAAFGEKASFAQGLRTFDAFRELDACPLHSTVQDISREAIPATDRLQCSPPGDVARVEPQR